MRKRLRNTMKYTRNLLFILMMLSIFVSCEDFFLSEADNVDIPGSEPQLVVNSFISPQDTLIRVYVHRSKPYAQAPNDFVPVNGKADVFMAKKGEEFVQLAYDEDLMSFTIDAQEFVVEANNYYVLKVEAYDGDYAEAECFVPGFEVDEVNVHEPERMYDEYGYQNVKIDWSVKPPGDTQERYYRTGAYIYTCLEEGDEQNQYYPPCWSEIIWIDRGNEFFSDIGGDLYLFKGTYWGNLNIDLDGPGNPYPTDPNRTDSVFVFLMQTDFHYFRFHQSVENYYYYDDDFPFAESVHIYSNIKGGLGTFGGYNRKNYLVAATAP